MIAGGLCALWMGTFSRVTKVVDFEVEARKGEDEYAEYGGSDGLR